ncbi:hypothetical protein ACFPFV_12540 [Salinicoccus siamensis]
MAPPPEGSNQVTHGISFYLIDQEGKVIKDYQEWTQGIMNSHSKKWSLT